MSPILTGVIASSQFSGGAAGTYEFIALGTATGSSTTLAFNSIPQTYQHLELRYVGKNNRPRLADGFLNLKMNNSYSTYAQSMYYRGSGTTVPEEITFSPTSEGTGYFMGASGGNSNASAMSIGIIRIADYTSTTKLKTARCMSASNISDSNLGWILHSTQTNNSTSAITSLVIETVDSSGGYTIGANSRFALYGLKAS